MEAEQPELVLPDDFDEYAWEVESKGVFWDVRVRYGGREYPVTFYEPERLAQDAAEELDEGKPFFEPNIIVVRKVSKDAMIAAVAELAKDDRILNLKEIAKPAP